MSVFEMLRTKFANFHLTGFRNGWFDESQSKLYAYSVLDAKDEDFQLYLPSISSYGFWGPPVDDKRLIIPVDNNCFQYKQLPQLIDENIFNRVSIKFSGVYFQGDWYFNRVYTFYEHGSIEEISKEIESAFLQDPPFNDPWQFGPVPEYTMELDVEKINAMLSEKLGRVVDIFGIDHAKLRPLVDKMTDGNWPKRQVPQPAIYRDFIGMPWLVAIQKVEEKREINAAYEKHIYNEILRPLTSTLSRLQPARFHNIYAIGGGMYKFIYPQSKSHFLGAFAVTDNNNRESVFYFLYDSTVRKIYEWTLPTARQVESFFWFNVESEFDKLLSNGRNIELDDQAITLDDPKFWNDHVFKKENGEYLYLKPIGIENSQPDIYTQW